MTDFLWAYGETTGLIFLIVGIAWWRSNKHPPRSEPDIDEHSAEDTWGTK